MSLYAGGPDDGSSIVISIPAWTTTLNFTACCWVMMPSYVANTRTILQIVNTTNGEVASLSSDAFGQLEFNCIATQTFSSGNYSLGQWFHVAISVQSSSATVHRLRGYANGQLVASSIPTGTPFLTNQIWIGSSFGFGAFPLTGYISNFRLWRRMLSQLEIQKEYQSFTPASKTNLYMWYPYYDDLYVDRSGKFGRVSTAIPTLGANGSLAPSINPPISFSANKNNNFSSWR